MRKKSIHILGGGTVYHIRPQFALCAPSFGQTARKIAGLSQLRWGPNYDVHLHLTRMACGGKSDLETNQDVEVFLKSLVNDPDCHVIFMAMSLCEFQGHVINGSTATDSGLKLPKLRGIDGRKLMVIDPVADLIAEIRKYRKDLVLVGFSTTSGSTDEDMFASGISTLERYSCNIVFASDFNTKSGIIIQSNQWIGKDRVSKNRIALLQELVQETHSISTSTTITEEMASAAAISL
ncbi:MAG TPA: hypothetical protein VIE65_21300 [Methylobacter sp.]